MKTSKKTTDQALKIQNSQLPLVRVIHSVFRTKVNNVVVSLISTRQGEKLVHIRILE
jgi:hypothetical protein